MNNTYSNRNSKSPVWKASHPLYGYVYDVDYEHLREYNTILARIGNNLNQIAKRMNATGNVYEADVKEVKELMKQVWQLMDLWMFRDPFQQEIFP